MVMGAGLCIGVNGYSAGPEFPCADTGEINGGSAGHTGCLRSVSGERIRGNDRDAVVFPRW